jgi:hypothetical protein
MKCLGFVLLFGFISLGAIGGCNNNGGGDSAFVDPADADAVLVGAHADQIVRELGFFLDLALYDGETLNNFIVDCLDIDFLTDEEKDGLKQAFDNGLIVFAYQSDEACVAKLFADIFQHPLIFEELDSLDIPPGESHDVFAAELHGIHIWTHQIVFGTLEEPGGTGSEDNPDHNPDGALDEDPLADLQFPIDTDLPLAGTFQEHSLEILKWILTYDNRRDILEDQGDVIFSAKSADLNMLDERTSVFLDPTMSSRVSDPTGTLGAIAASYIHTSTYTPKPPGGEDPTYSGNYQMTT